MGNIDAQKVLRFCFGFFKHYLNRQEETHQVSIDRQRENANNEISFSLNEEGPVPGVNLGEPRRHDAKSKEARPGKKEATYAYTL